MTDLAHRKAVIRRYLIASYISYKARVKKSIYIFDWKIKDGKKILMFWNTKPVRSFNKELFMLLSITIFLQIWKTLANLPGFTGC